MNSARLPREYGRIAGVAPLVATREVAMTLTADQVSKVNEGQPVTVTPPEVGAECVLLRADVYARIRNLLIYDDSEMDPREAYPAVLKALDEDDESPAQYLEYLNE
jgi:hypothetical protein